MEYEKEWMVLVGGNYMQIECVITVYTLNPRGSHSGLSVFLSELSSLTLVIHNNNSVWVVSMIL